MLLSKDYVKTIYVCLCVDERFNYKFYNGFLYARLKQMPSRIIVLRDHGEVGVVFWEDAVKDRVW